MKIAYEPHPVTPERKAELRAQGLKIIDARFAPKEAPRPITREDVAAMKKADVLDLLEAHGVEADKADKVGDLRDTLSRVMFAEL